VIGISLADLPGKRRLEQKLLVKPSVRRAVNGLRAQFGRPPLMLAEKHKT
jgi:hypothetical protein